MIKEVQRIQLDILIEVDRICKKHNIKYQLYAGTLLGAVRHRGFIPWDDDIDISMLRSDYNKFLKVAQEELDNSYFLQTPITDKKSFFAFAKIRRNNTLFFEQNTRKSNFHQGIFIDIFPLDSVDINNKKHRMIVKKINRMVKMNIHSHIEIKFNLKKILFLPIKLLLRTFRLSPTYYYNKIEKLTKKLNEVDSEYVNHFTNGVNKKRFERFLMKKTDALNLIDIEFEGYMFPVSKNYHEVLTRCYGEYMTLPPKEMQQPHHGVLISLDGKRVFNGYNDREGKLIDDRYYKIV